MPECYDAISDSPAGARGGLLKAFLIPRWAKMPKTKPKTRMALSMWIVAVELAIVFAGSTLPTPLYLLYRRSFGFSEITLTLIYAVYVLGNLSALFLFGRLSDQIGRKTTTVPALIIALISTIAFAFAVSTSWLFIARLLSGFATGLAAGTATAWITELQPRGDKTAATILAAAANLAGLSLGPLIGGMLAAYGPRPLLLPYLVYIAMLILVAISLCFSTETVEKHVHALKEISLRPRLGVPREIRSKFISPAVTAFGIFSLIGFYSALIPGLLAKDLHRSSPAVSGAVVVELFAIGAIAVALGRTVRSRTAMLTGLVILLPSLGLLIMAQTTSSFPLLLAGTAFGGISSGFGYRGSLEVVNEISPDEKRSEVVSSYLIVCYLGNSIPVIGVGLLSQLAGPLTAHVSFAGVVCVFALVGVVTGVKYRPDESSAHS